MASSDSNPTVFVYEQSELNHGWLKACDGFEKIRLSSQNDNLAEVGMREALLASELRVRDPAQALLFYVPVFEFASAHLGTCGNTTHTTRMAAANTALLASPWVRAERRCAATQRRAEAPPQCASLARQGRGEGAADAPLTRQHAQLAQFNEARRAWRAAIASVAPAAWR